MDIRKASSGEIFRTSIADLLRQNTELHDAARWLHSELDVYGARLVEIPITVDRGVELQIRVHRMVTAEVIGITHELSDNAISLAALDVVQVTGVEIQTWVARQRELFQRLRVCTANSAAIFSGLNWQAPEVKSTTGIRRGVERFPVVTDYNDYKRDRSSDTFYCEKRISEALFAEYKHPCTPTFNLCNCGMASFTPILYHILCEGDSSRKILASSSCYVENTLLLQDLFRDRLVSFNTSATEEILGLIHEHQPEAIFLDAICNAFEMPIIDVESVLKGIVSTYREPIVISFDATCCLGFENIVKGLELPSNVVLFIHGSLLKAPQLGMDRVNAGFVLSFGLDSRERKILEYRTLSGTTIQDFGGYLIPYSSRDSVRSRLATQQRNLIEIAKTLRELDQYRRIIDTVVYPGLPDHPDHAKGCALGFFGPFLTLRLINTLNNDDYFELFTRIVLARAAAHKAEVVHGASYGFNHSSIYYSVGWETPESHYLRISVGTETAFELEKLKLVFCEAYAEFRDRVLNYRDSELEELR